MANFHLFNWLTDWNFEQYWHRVYVKMCIPHLHCQLLSIFGPLTWSNFSVLAAASIIIAFIVSVYTDTSCSRERAIYVYHQMWHAAILLLITFFSPLFQILSNFCWSCVLNFNYVVLLIELLRNLSLQANCIEAVSVCPCLDSSSDTDQLESLYFFFGWILALLEHFSRSKGCIGCQMFLCSSVFLHRANGNRKLHVQNWVITSVEGYFLSLTQSKCILEIRSCLKLRQPRAFPKCPSSKCPSQPRGVQVSVMNYYLWKLS